MQLGILPGILTKDLHYARLEFGIGHSLNAGSKDPRGVGGEVPMSVAFERNFARSAGGKKNLTRLIVGAAPSGRACASQRGTESSMRTFHRVRRHDKAFAHVSAGAMHWRRPHGKAGVTARVTTVSKNRHAHSGGDFVEDGREIVIDYEETVVEIDWANRFILIRGITAGFVTVEVGQLCAVARELKHHHVTSARRAEHIGELTEDGAARGFTVEEHFRLLKAK
jgi:hypothetical protein